MRYPDNQTDAGLADASLTDLSPNGATHVNTNLGGSDLVGVSLVGTD